ncbi:lysine transporter LysE [Neiella marina]|uniref:Lysine transporter LysE n=1 Tax=Neiella marina TaxID=508461 RepID=A0A8J2U5M9_9GAMM|nr:LysE family translocator [Neiella marina]GGA79279.1 lysine transporter LysE [Neiella marina]
MDLWPILFFVVSTSITPGPNNIMILTSGVNHGWRQSIPHLLGIDIGFPLMVIAIGLGLSGVFSAYPVIQNIIKYLGISYLLYLSYLIATSSAVVATDKQRPPFSFIQAALFQWLNPKAWIMAIGAVASFTQAGQSLHWQVLTIAGLYFIAGTPCTICWLLAGQGLRRWLNRPQARRWFNYCMASLLVVSLLPSIAEEVRRWWP